MATRTVTFAVTIENRRCFLPLRSFELAVVGKKSGTPFVGIFPYSRRNRERQGIPKATHVFVGKGEEGIGFQQDLSHGKGMDPGRQIQRQMPRHSQGVIGQENQRKQADPALSLLSGKKTVVENAPGAGELDRDGEYRTDQGESGEARAVVRESKRENEKEIDSEDRDVF